MYVIMINRCLGLDGNMRKMRSRSICEASLDGSELRCKELKLKTQKRNSIVVSEMADIHDLNIECGCEFPG